MVVFGFAFDRSDAARFPSSLSLQATSNHPERESMRLSRE